MQFKRGIFAAISFTKNVIKKHDPTKKQPDGMTNKTEVYVIIDSRSKATEYP